MCRTGREVPRQEVHKQYAAYRIPYDEWGHVGDVHVTIRYVLAREASQVMLHVDLRGAKSEMCSNQIHRDVLAREPSQVMLHVDLRGARTYTCDLPAVLSGLGT